jgi:hypothetical protein
VWITGLSGEFPSIGDAIPLDLRAFRRLPGESDPASRDLYALLETLVSSTESVSLSWARRGTDGRERQPSRALTGLMAWLENDVLPEGTPFDFEDWLPVTPPPPPQAGNVPVTYAETAPRGAQKLRDLELFLRNPVLHTVNRLVRPDDRDLLDDREPGISEDLFLDRWKGEALLDACLRAELLVPGSAIAEFDRLWTQRKRGGRVPPAPWGMIAEARLRDLLVTKVANESETLREILATTGLRFAGSLRLGPQGAERPAPPVINRPAFEAASLGVDLRLGGMLPWFFRGPAGWALLTYPNREMTAYLLQLCTVALTPLPESLAGIFAGTGRLLLRDEDGAITVQPLPPMDAAFARETLRDLLTGFSQALRGEGHLEDVPLDAVADVLEDGRDADVVGDWSEAVTELRRRAAETGRERVSKQERARRAVDPELSADMRDRIQHRILPYLKWRDNFGATAGVGTGQAGT